MEAKKKFSMSTDTDLHFDMLADKSKLKMVPNYNLNDEMLNENDSNSSDSSMKINNLDMSGSESEKKSPKYSKSVENSRSYDSVNEKEQQNFDTQPFNQPFTNDRPFNNNHTFLDNNQVDIDNNHSGIYNNEQTENYDARLNVNPNIHQLNNMPNPPFNMLDEQTQKMKKMEIYAELLSIKRLGITLTKEYSINSNYDEMVFEVQYWNSYQKKKDAVEIGKNFMINAITALEFMNESYDPFGLKLKGWSEQVELNKDSYNTVFGELYEKYKSTGRKVEPEIKLILMVGASAASFHASKKMAESLPGLDSVLQSNPDLLSKLQGVINKNISEQGNKKEEDPNISQQKMYEQMQKLKQQQAQFSEVKKQQTKVEDNNKKLSEQLNQVNANNNTKEPSSNISNILNKIKAQNAARKAEDVINNNLSDNSEERVSIKSENSKSSNKSNNSVETITLGSDGKPKRKKRSAKSTISIVTG